MVYHSHFPNELHLLYQIDVCTPVFTEALLGTLSGHQLLGIPQQMLGLF